MDINIKVPVKSRMPVNIDNFQELLATFADIESEKVAFDADKYEPFWDYPVDDVFWKLDDRGFLVTKESYKSIFKDYAKNLESLMTKINPPAKVLKPKVLAVIGRDIKKFIYKKVIDPETLEAFDVKNIGFHLMLKLIDAQIFSASNSCLAYLASIELIQSFTQMEITVEYQEFMANFIHYYLYTNKTFPEYIFRFQYFDNMEF